MRAGAILKQGMALARHLGCMIPASGKAVLLCVGIVLLSGEARAVLAGASREDLLNEKGAPTSETTSERRSVLTFADRSTAVLEDGIVVRVTEGVQAAPVVVSPQPVVVDRGGERINPARVVVAVIVVLIAGVFLYRAIFPSWGHCKQALRRYRFPLWSYMNDGDWYAVQEARASLFLWVVLALGAGLVVYAWMGGSLAPIVKWLTR